MLEILLLRDHSLQDEGRPNVYSQIFSIPYSSKEQENKSIEATTEKSKKRAKQPKRDDASKTKKPRKSKRKNDIIKVINPTNEDIKSINPNFDAKKSANDELKKTAKLANEKLYECKIIDSRILELTTDCIQMSEKERIFEKKEKTTYKVPLWIKNELKDLENYRLV